MSDKLKELGSFLKSKRALIAPEQVGLPSTIRRRTEGLRREEVALLADISTTWYTWLEQGRNIQVSEHVMSNIAKTLRLTDSETEYIFILADMTYTNKNSNNLIKPYLYDVINNINAPAYIMDTRWNVHIWNEHASDIFIDFEKLPKNERNIIKLMFFNNEYKSIFTDWEYHARGIVNRFRSDYAKNIYDKWYKEFIKEMSAGSDDFSRWWAAPSVDGMSEIVKEIEHPKLGKVTFQFSSFDVSDNDSLRLILHTQKI